MVGSQGGISQLSMLSGKLALKLSAVALTFVGSLCLVSRDDSIFFSSTACLGAECRSGMYDLFFFFLTLEPIQQKIQY